MAENNYDLKFTQKAREDLEEIYRYISDELLVEFTANNLLERIESRKICTPGV